MRCCAFAGPHGPTHGFAFSHDMSDDGHDGHDGHSGHEPWPVSHGMPWVIAHFHLVFQNFQKT